MVITFPKSFSWHMHGNISWLINAIISVETGVWFELIAVMLLIVHHSHKCPVTPQTLFIESQVLLKVSALRSQRERPNVVMRLIQERMPRQPKELVSLWHCGAEGREIRCVFQV